MYFLRPSNLDELYEKFTGCVKELYEELLAQKIFFKEKERKEDRLFLKEKDAEGRGGSEENFAEKIKNLTDFLNINSAIKAFFSKLKVQKLKFTFSKLILLTDGIGLSYNEFDQFCEDSKYFGLSSLIILIGNNLDLFFISPH